jgi:protein-tyrosine phosphatase
VAATVRRRVIDLHAHILPGLDDGPAALPEALEMARVAVESGIRTIAATPHVNHAYLVQPEAIPVAVAALNRTLGREGIPLEVVAGGEIAVTRLIELDEHALVGLRLGRGPWLLVEAPLGYAPNQFDAIVLGLRERGHEILLAHPERSAYFLQDIARLGELVGAGVRCSITAASMSGQFGETVRRFTIELLAAGLVHDVASDAHDHHHRPPVLLEGFARADEELPGLAAQADWFTSAVPAAILAGEPLPKAPSPPRRRRRRMRLPRLRR